MTLTDYSKKHGVSRKTAWNHFSKGLIPGAYQLPSGKIIIPDGVNPNAEIIALLEQAIGRLKA